MAVYEPIIGAPLPNGDMNGSPLSNGSTSSATAIKKTREIEGAGDSKFGSDDEKENSDPHPEVELRVGGEENPIKSPVACPLLSNEDTPQKKQQLAWGQGLTKFEKKKVEGPPDTTGKSSLVECASSPKVNQDDTGTETNPDCTLPITPGSDKLPGRIEGWWRGESCQISGGLPSAI